MWQLNLTLNLNLYSYIPESNWTEPRAETQRQWHPLWQSPGFSIPLFWDVAKNNKRFFCHRKLTLGTEFRAASPCCVEGKMSRSRRCTYSLCKCPGDVSVEAGWQTLRTHTHVRERQLGDLLRDEDKHRTRQDVCVHKEMSAHTHKRGRHWWNSDVPTNDLKLLAEWNYVTWIMIACLGFYPPQRNPGSMTQCYKFHVKGLKC